MTVRVEQIHFQFAGLELGLRGFLRLAAAEAFDAGEQFGEGIGLGEIVIAACPQALDALIDIAERGENERRRGDAFIADGADDRKPVALGQHAVDDQHVVNAFARQCQAFIAIGGMIGDVAALGQSLDQPGSGVAVVFNDQNSHSVLQRACNDSFGIALIACMTRCS